jgi:hypothetical protein
VPLPTAHYASDTLETELSHGDKSMTNHQSSYGAVYTLILLQLFKAYMNRVGDYGLEDRKTIIK